MAGHKLDLDKLRKSMSARPRPSEVEGTSKKKEYGTAYKSPYSKRAEITKRPSAPTVLVSSPPPPPPKAPAVSQYSQSEMNKGRPKSPKPKQDASPNSQRAPTKLTQKISGVSGYFASTEKRNSEVKPRKLGTFQSPLMNAPSWKAQENAGGSTRPRAASLSASPRNEEKPLQTPPPLIPPKPAKTENLPQILPAAPLLIRNQRKEKEAEAPVETQQKKVHTRGRVSFFKEPAQPEGKVKRVSLMLDPTNRRSIRDGSIDLSLEQIATAQVTTNEQEDDDDDYGEPIDYFDIQQQVQKDDSLITIRHQSPRNDLQETFTEWTQHRTNFLIIFVAYVFCACLSIVLSQLFVFYFNYGTEIPHYVTNNSTLNKHMRQRQLLNTHMVISLVPNIQLLQFSSMLYRIFPTFSRTKMKWIHGTFNLIAAGSRIWGVTYSIAYHALSGSADLSSMHSYVAVLSMLIHMISMMTGIFFVLPCCSWETQVTLIPLHRYFGNIIIISDTAVVVTGCIQMSQKYFDSAHFPEYYPNSYSSLSTKSIILNLLAFAVFLSAATTMYLQAHYEFRRRRKPGESSNKDLDLEAINRVTERRQFKALAKEAKEHGKNDNEEIQIGSRKSFNLAGKQKYWHLVNKGKSIPALINEAEKQKSNFTDTDILLALE